MEALPLALAKSIYHNFKIYSIHVVMCGIILDFQP